MRRPPHRAPRDRGGERYRVASASPRRRVAEPARRRGPPRPGRGDRLPSAGAPPRARVAEPERAARPKVAGRRNERGTGPPRWRDAPLASARLRCRRPPCSGSGVGGRRRRREKLLAGARGRSVRPRAGREPAARRGAGRVALSAVPRRRPRRPGPSAGAPAAPRRRGAESRPSTGRATRRRQRDGSGSSDAPSSRSHWDFPKVVTHVPCQNRHRRTAWRFPPLAALRSSVGGDRCPVVRAVALCHPYHLRSE